ncbi:hypothetical protein MKL26_02885 [Streptococcus suis]|nr:hypothetical protein [Streptococcus suis]
MSYVDSIEVETFETNGLLKFKKKYRIKGVPDNNTYEVIRETEHLTGYPINDLTVRLLHPSKKFTFSASIDDTDDEYGILFNLKASVFLPFRQKKRTNMCKITRTHVDVQVDEFLPNGSGINIIVQPFLNKNFDILLGMSKYNKEDVHKMEVYNYWMNPVDKDETNNY